MRKRLRTLADLARLALCGVCVLAAGTAALWTGRVDRLCVVLGRPDPFGDADNPLTKVERWLDRKWNGPYYRRFDEAAALKNPQAAVAAMTQLAADLQHVGRQDHLAAKRTQTYEWLCNAAETSGDLDKAIDWMQQSVAFDDHHSVLTQTRLARLLCRDPGKRVEGVGMLEGLTALFPSHPLVVPPLVEGLAAIGRVQQAWEYLRAATEAPQGNLWVVLWNTGDGFDLDGRRCELLQVVEHGVLRLRFKVDENVIGLQLWAPDFSSALMTEPRLCTTVAGERRSLDLGDPALVTTQNMRLAPGRLQTDGVGGEWFAVALPTPLPAGSPVEFTARIAPLPSAAVADAARLPTLAGLGDELRRRGDTDGLQRFRRLRALSIADDAFEVFWTDGDQPFRQEQSTRAPIAIDPGPGAVRFSARIEAKMPGDLLRLDLPAGVGTTFRFARLLLQQGGREVAIDPAAVELVASKSIERADGGVTVTGEDPYLVFRVTGAPVEAVAIDGEAQ
jgi:hypothetical protein